MSSSKLIASLIVAVLFSVSFSNVQSALSSPSSVRQRAEDARQRVEATKARLIERREAIKSRRRGGGGDGGGTPIPLFVVPQVCGAGSSAFTGPNTLSVTNSFTGSAERDGFNIYQSVPGSGTSQPAPAPFDFGILSFTVSGVQPEPVPGDTYIEVKVVHEGGQSATLYFGINLVNGAYDVVCDLQSLATSNGITARPAVIQVTTYSFVNANGNTNGVITNQFSNIQLGEQSLDGDLTRTDGCQVPGSV